MNYFSFTFTCTACKSIKLTDSFFKKNGGSPEIYFVFISLSFMVKNLCPRYAIFNERKLVLGLVLVSICLCESHKKFINSKILIEWINDLGHGYIVYDEVKYCPLFSNIAQYCPILDNIVQYCSTLPNIVLY